MPEPNYTFEVPLEKLRWRCPADSVQYAAAAEMAAGANIIGQERALQALKIGLQLKAPGYNIYVMGPSNSGKTMLVKTLLEELQRQGPVPPDLCYVYNFQNPDAPQALSLPAGRGRALAKDLEELAAALRSAVETGEFFKTRGEENRPDKSARREALEVLIRKRLAELKNKYALANILTYFERVQTFLFSFISTFAEREFIASLAPPNFFELKVNVVVDNSALLGAPVIHETAPTHKNLFGGIGRVQDQAGVWRSDFMQIKAGALARANGGYLLFNITDAFGEPGIWRMLKRTLRHRRLEISAPDLLEASAASGLRPEPMALDLKVIVIADSEEYHNFYRQDSEFKNIFKIRAEFDATVPNTIAAHRQYIGLIKKNCRQESWRELDDAALAAVIEFGVWLTDAQSKISACFGYVVDLLRETDFGAQEEGSPIIRRQHIRRALREKNYRQRAGEDRHFERVRAGKNLLDVEGRKVGQINALTVWPYYEHSYGCPLRLTAAVGMGSAGIINIERDADISGKLHNKGVAIVAGYLRNQYAHDKPLSMSASIAFEQSGGIDGDSASAAEAFVILSALSGVPLRQNLAVTGSMNQRGEIQGIGSVNEKIEGFFQACQMKGCTGTQGVIIPQHNVDDLMLREEVVDAVAAGQFHIFAIKQLDEGLELMTGVVAGEKDAEGKYPEGSIHFKVDQRLRELNKEKKDNKTNGEEKKDDKAAA